MGRRAAGLAGPHRMSDEGDRMSDVKHETTGATSSAGLAGPNDAADGVVLSAEDKAARDRRSRFLGLALVAFAVLFFVVTIVRLGANVANRSSAGY